MSDSLVKEPYFYKVRSKVNASALEEHQASSSENCDSLTLWRCDFTTLPSLRVTERHTCTPTSFTLSLVKLVSGTDLRGEKTAQHT